MCGNDQVSNDQVCWRRAADTPSKVCFCLNWEGQGAASGAPAEEGERVQGEESRVEVCRMKGL